MEDNIKFDDVEAELLYTMLIDYLEHNTWKVYEVDEWEELLRIKKIEEKLARRLRGRTVQSQP